MKLSQVEINRKLIHTSSAALPVLYWFWIPANVMIFGLVLINLAFIVIEYQRLLGTRTGKMLEWFFKPAIRAQEATKVTGAAFVFLGNLATIALFPKQIAVPALLILSISDSFAALIGIPFGKHLLGKKSVEGSLAFFISAIAVLAFFPEIGWQTKILGALTGMVIEAFLKQIDDNIAIPVSVALVIWAFS